MSENQEFRDSIFIYLDNQDLLARQAKLNAVLLKISYDALIQAGFEQHQAMEIIKSKNPFLI